MAGGMFAPPTTFCCCKSQQNGNLFQHSCQLLQVQAKWENLETQLLLRQAKHLAFQQKCQQCKTDITALLRKGVTHFARFWLPYNVSFWRNLTM